GTPLHLACRRGDERSARALMEAGADIHRLSDAKTSVLTEAIHGGLSRLAGELLQQGIKPYEGDRVERTAIYQAIERGDLDLNRQLIDTGYLKGIPALRPRILQARKLYYHPASVQAGLLRLLVPHLKDHINGTDGNGVTPLILATYGSRNETEAVQALIELGAEPTIKDNTGLTPLAWARQIGHHKVAAYLESVSPETDGGADDAEEETGVSEPEG
ncbi:MAG: ankyrin repeat domain-containing protein, partial [Verrucomicrobiota bacterium]